MDDERISFSGKMLAAGQLIKTNFEIPAEVEFPPVSDKPALACTSKPESNPRIDTETSQEQGRQSAAGQSTAQDI
jgi:hypothetical protein